jgi:hypothetical protein
MADNRYTVSQKTFADLANRLQKFSAQLPPDQQTMLSAIMVLAARELGSSKEDEYGRGKPGVQTDSFTNLQKDFLEAFSRFAPNAFPKPATPPVSDELAKVTVCIE